MEYQTTEDLCSKIRESLKKEIPQCKLSVVGENYSMGRSINVALMEGTFDAFKVNPERMYAQLNHYQFNGYNEGINNGALLTQECWDVMKKATEITSRDHWDKSDIQSDYFNCNFYIHMAIGKWDKPYVKKEAK